ncbi:cytochrome c-type biogenesis protein [Moraxella nasicaprae]|uniref:Cytochrome c-type biogenesis protein n=1 Tax=Moraxella nasicaprae TaxID=2904122 RepID=A0ABY6F4W3_9GAMM|nr:cytochrome c-type biogenesis protein [Moraxella nasicaprae]UXZ05115.1 cytochrome c-type biogenesis protein CcmH [Moraxella nasicaprae]
MNINQSILAMLLSAVMMTATASIDLHQFDSPEQENRYRALIEELRCPKCQNQNLAGSDAPIAQDLKQQTYEMIKAGRSDTEIRNYMFERYGDFISYKPPIRPSTWILWFFPPVLLLMLLLGWLYKSRGHNAKKFDEPTDELSASEEAKIAKILATHQQTQNKESS